MLPCCAGYLLGSLQEQADNTTAAGSPIPKPEHSKPQPWEQMSSQEERSVGAGRDGDPSPAQVAGVRALWAQGSALEVLENQWWPHQWPGDQPNAEPPAETPEESKLLKKASLGCPEQEKQMNPQCYCL